MRKNVCKLGCFVAVIPLMAGQLAAQTATFNTIYEFQGGPNDGRRPESGVTVGPDGVLFGTTVGGGAEYGGGTVFALKPPASPGGAWTETLIYEFTPAAHGIGNEPSAGLAIASDGVIYGVAPAGGYYGVGTAFSLQPPGSPGGYWKGSRIYDQAFTQAKPVIGHGVLYLTNRSGVAGEIVSLNPPSSGSGRWNERVLYTLAGGADGEYPGALTPGPGEVLYGTTLQGGSGNCAPLTGCGTVFSMTPPSAPGGAWTHTVLYSFVGGAIDGASPYMLAPLAIDSNGVLYGTTDSGGTFNQGVVYSLTPPASPGGEWTESVIYNFESAGTTGSGRPSVVIGAGGVLYGTNGRGGIDNCGTVYSLTPPAAPGGPWTEETLYTFTGGSDGRDPVGGLVTGPGGVLYGTTETGGLHPSACEKTSGCGTVFSVTP